MQLLFSVPCVLVRSFRVLFVFSICFLSGLFLCYLSPFRLLTHTWRKLCVHMPVYISLSLVLSTPLAGCKQPVSGRTASGIIVGASHQKLTSEGLWSRSSPRPKKTMEKFALILFFIETLGGRENAEFSASGVPRRRPRSRFKAAPASNHPSYGFRLFSPRHRGGPTEWPPIEKVRGTNLNWGQHSVRNFKFLVLAKGSHQKTELRMRSF